MTWRHADWRHGLHGVLVRPSIENEERVGVVELLVKDVVDASLLHACGLYEHEDQVPNSFPVGALATEFADDVALLGFLRAHARFLPA
jgi:hypothetical protein